MILKRLCNRWPTAWCCRILHLLPDYPRIWSVMGWFVCGILFRMRSSCSLSCRGLTGLWMMWRCLIPFCCWSATWLSYEKDECLLKVLAEERDSDLCKTPRILSELSCKPLLLMGLYLDSDILELYLQSKYVQSCCIPYPANYSGTGVGDVSTFGRNGTNLLMLIQDRECKIEWCCRSANLDPGLCFSTCSSLLFQVQPICGVLIVTCRMGGHDDVPFNKLSLHVRYLSSVAWEPSKLVIRVTAGGGNAYGGWCTF